jgi:trigger factor
MHITETNAEGLKHEFKIVIPADDIANRIDERLKEIGKTANLPGFRPGKAPLAILKKRFLPTVMGEVVQHAVNDGADEVIKEHKLRPALQPKVEITSFDEGKDLEYTLGIEALPDIEPMNFADIKLEKLVPEVPAEEIDQALQKMAERQRKSEKVDRPADKGDVVIIDFTGSVDGKEFPGGSSTDYKLELGSNSFIPGFEDQLVGASAGETREVNVTFPAEYGAPDLAGKAAKFVVPVKEVQEFKPRPIDDELASELGMENLEALRQVMREQIERDYGEVARQRLKRHLLDQLSGNHHFPVPPGMVEAEYQAIWRQFEDQRTRAKAAGETDYEGGKSEDEIKAEFRTIAERRVRLGLLLSEVGQRNNISVAQEEINQALIAEARRFPGQERQVIEYYRNQPGAIDGLRAPILENKVVDHILSQAQVSERSVPAPELIAAEEAEGTKGQEDGSA